MSDQPPQAANKGGKDNEKKGKEKKGKGKKGPVIDVESLKGTRDFYPEDMRLRNWLFGHFKEVAKNYGFQEYDAPVLESDELYKRKAGEEITQQMYSFIDKGDRPVTLRPEMTPSLARMVMKAGQFPVPAKWFSIPQCWRYESMCRGRNREHYQWNMDVIGVTGAGAEVELLAAVTTFFKRVGLTAKDVGIKINSRRVLQSILDTYGVPPDQFAPACVVVDKIDKIGADAVKQELEAIGIVSETADKIINTLQLKSIDTLAELVGSQDNPAVKELKEIFTLATAYGIEDWLIFDASVVRGLAYYTGVVFECFDRKGELRAICGGGRYDKLMSLYGGKDVPCCGFGFGDCVIVELLKERKLMPKLETGIEYVVIASEQSLFAHGLSVAAKLRDAGRVVDMLPEPKKRLDAALKYAQRIGARKAVLLMSNEWEKGTVLVKDLEADKDSANKQIEVPVSFLAQMPSADASNDDVVEALSKLSV